MSRTARGLGVLAASAVLCALLPGTAHAAAQVSLSVTTADPDYATNVTLRGTGFQAVAKAHGGVYITFGWVADGAWQPSRGGSAGATYRYVQDTEDKNNKGYQRYVAFPGSDTAASANGGVMSADGSWSTNMVIPGARFRAVDRAGNTSEVDCTKVRCGFITMGAHGVVNANNETFTPVRFAAPAGTANQPGTQAQAPAPAQQQQQGTPQQAGQPAARAATVSSATGVVEAGREVTVTGTGFAADEQLTVTLGPSKMFLAPAKSDAAGAVSHTATIPADVPAGAYTLDLTGASSGAVGSVPLTVTAAAAQAAPQPVAAESSTSDPVPWWWVAAGAAFLLLIITVLFLRKRKKVEA
ncbi:hypothetical protein SAMN05216553_10595 [Lentzea fradiae]|uniref:IPT/TIG domain-containing protein n=1 Tax=Lentzea fradiae TaxID=200378 RepID=A0A1G7R3U0_9PSEU|nr:hypothetical protein [Lentzea fradiae]SDG05398.1 hypothetical protein SAMN05216553_10595 [Lentzea fradiae]